MYIVWPQIARFLISLSVFVQSEVIIFIFLSLEKLSHQKIATSPSTLLPVMPVGVSNRPIDRPYAFGDTLYMTILTMLTCRQYRIYLRILGFSWYCRRVYGKGGIIYRWTIFQPGRKAAGQQLGPTKARVRTCPYVARMVRLMDDIM